MEKQSQDMEELHLAYKSDSFGNDILTRLIWAKESKRANRPIVIIYHAGGLVMGSYDTVPKAQIDYFCKNGFVVVAPNYRLAPQVSGSEAFRDAEDALDWTIVTLPEIAEKQLGVTLDTRNVVAMGHSSGGTMVLHLTSIGKPLRAVTALYPFLFVADKSTEAHHPSTFGDADVAEPNGEEWALIAPAGRQVSDAPFTLDSSSVRSNWIKYIFSSGRWMSSIQPDGNFAAIDPMTRVNSDWASTMIIHGSLDNLPGRSVELVNRAAAEFKARGHTRGVIQVLEGADHVFDHDPSLGVSDFGEKWQAVVKGMNWLIQHCKFQDSRT